MGIKAKGKLDFDALKELTYIWLYKKNEPQKRIKIYTISYTFLFLIILLEMYLFGIDTSLCLLLAVVVFGYALQCYLHFLLPKIRYNSLKMMKDIVNEYFFQEEILHITSNNEEYSAQCDIKYSLITKIYETKRYFIIYHNHTQAYIVDKSTFEDGATEDIRQILPAKINGKFVKCNW